MSDLALNVEIEKVDGRRFRFGFDEPRSGNRPLDLSFSTRLQEGFAEGGFTLPRSPGAYPDVGVYDTVRFTDSKGRVAYEGRGAALPGDSNIDKRLQVRCAGWMSHARDRPCNPILFVDRDISQWGSISARSQVTYLAANNPYTAPEMLEDESTPAIRLRLENDWVAPQLPISSALYVAPPGQKISRIRFDFTGDSNTFFVLYPMVADTDAGWLGGQTNGQTLADVYTVASGTVNWVPTTPCRFGEIIWHYQSTPAGTPGYIFQVQLRGLAVFGNTGIPLRSLPGVDGHYASDMLKYIARVYTPLLDASKIPDTDIIYNHCVFREPIDPYDAWIHINRVEGREIAVWENKQLVLESPSTDTDWQVSDRDRNVSVQNSGVSVDNQANGIIVNYQNIETMRSDVVGPTDDIRLADTNPEIPANIAKVAAYERVQLPDPYTREQAIQFGRTVLSRLNTQRQPSVITIKGLITDASGIPRPGYMVRSGQNIRVEDSTGVSLRHTYETQWDDNTKTLTATMDGDALGVDSILDQLLTDRKQAKGASV